MQNIIKNIITVALTFFVIHNLLYANDWGKVSEEEWAMQPPRKYEDINAMIIFDIGTMEVSKEGIHFYRHVRLKVFNKAGADDVGDIEIYYMKDDKLRGFKAQTITPNGEKHKVSKKKGVFTKTYSDGKAKVFSFPSIEDGSILEYKYENRNLRFGFLDPWYFQNNLFTKLSIFNLKLHPGFIYTSATSHVPGGDQKPVMDEEKRSKIRTFTWDMKNIPPLKAEPYMTSLKDYRSALRYQLVAYRYGGQEVEFIKNWSDLGEIFSNVLDKYTNNSKLIKGKVIPLTAGISDTINLLRTIYNHVKNEISTDSSSNYFSHDNIDELISKGFGTQDEKNILLVEMLKEAGIKAYPVLISTRDNGLFYSQIYQLQQFNHIIVFADILPEGLFMDASTKYCPFSILPPNCITNGGLLIDKKNSKKVKIKTNLPETIRKDMTSIYIGDNGTAICSTTTKLSGYYTASYGFGFESYQQDEFIEKYLLGELDVDYTIDDFSFEQDSSNNCVIKYSYTLNDFVETLESNRIIKNLIFEFKENPFVDSKRNFPIDFAFPFTYRNLVQVKTASDNTTIQLPEDVSFSIGGAKFSRRSISGFGVANIESKLVMEYFLYPPSYYSEIKDFFELIESANSDQVILTNN